MKYKVIFRKKKRKMILNRIYVYWGILVLQLLLSGYLQVSFGEPVTTIRNNGEPANRVDIAIVGEGYTASQMSKYAIDVEIAVTGFFNEEPFTEYQNYFNVHRVEVISNESGVDHPERSEFKDTAFDATYNCSGIQRLICVDNSKVNNVLSNSVASNQRDVVLVIVNDPEYGGSGGVISVASTNSSVVDLVLHEIGHSFGLLADEYTTNPPACNNTIEPSEPNVTRETNRSLIRWNIGGGPPTGWIDLNTPVPTINNLALPGLYEGARYCSSGLYRATFNSKMRSLGTPFEQINEEQLVKRIYNFASPLESSSPANANLTLLSGQNLVFQVSVLNPLTHSLDATWYVNGELVGTGYEFILEPASANVGVQTVECVINDPTSKVRNDPNKVLTERQAWNVTDPGMITNITQDWGGTNGITITWESASGLVYQIASKDDYAGTFSVVDTVTATAGSTSWTDEGSMTGVHPSAAQERYYKITQNGVDLHNIVGMYQIVVRGGMNLISLPLIPFSTALEDVIGVQVTGADNIGASDLIWVWDGIKYTLAWLVGGTGTSLDGKWYTGNNPTTVQFGADQGAWLQIRPGRGPVGLRFVGEVSNTNRTIPIVEGMNLVGTCFPYPVDFSLSNLWESGFTGADNVGASDIVWNWVNDRYELIWLVDGVGNTFNGKWYIGSTEVNRTLKPGSGYWIQRREGQGVFDWVYLRQ